MKELKISDEVLQFSYGRVKREAITGITPAGNYKVGNNVYTSKDGTLRGSGGFSKYDSRIEPFDADKWEAIKTASANKAIRQGVKNAIDAGVVTDEMYRAIYAIIHPAKAGE